jgi:hypothetical protein
MTVKTILKNNHYYKNNSTILLITITKLITVNSLQTLTFGFLVPYLINGKPDRFC